MTTKPRSRLHARIGERVRTLRLARGWTQAEIAEQAGCSSHFISGIERGVDSPSLMTLERLADVLRTSVARLVDEDQLKPPARALAELQRLLEERQDDARVLSMLREVIAMYAPNGKRKGG